MLSSTQQAAFWPSALAQLTPQSLCAEVSEVRMITVMPFASILYVGTV